MRRQSIFLTALILLTVGALTFAFGSRDIDAQGANLLTNPGFEGGYFLQDNIVEIAVPNGWRMHWLDNVAFEGSQGPALRPETVVWNINDAPMHERPIFWRDGTYNVKIFKGGAPVYAGMSQDLTLEKGATYRFTVPIFVDVVGEYTPSGKTPPSNQLAGGVRLGAGATGAAFRDSGQINFSQWFNGSNTPNFYLNMLDYTFEFVATSDQTTVWFEVFGSEARPNNGFFVDGLSLVKIQDAIPPTATPVPATATPIYPTPTQLPVGPWYTPVPTRIWPTAVPTSIPPTAEPTVIANANVGGAAAAPAPAPQAVPFVPAVIEPDEDGVLYAVVGLNDSVWSIAAKNGLTLDEILELNGYPAGSNPFVSAGDRLIVGYAEVEEPAAEEAAAEETAEDAGEAEEAAAEEAAEEEAAEEEAAEEAAEPVVVTPEPSPTPAGAEICLSAYEDTNENAVFDAGEPLRADVAFTILNGERVVSNYITTGQEPFCVKGLEAGSYRVTRSKMDNELLTSGGEMAIALTNGATVEVVFGSIQMDPSEQADVALANNVAEVVESDAAEEVAAAEEAAAEEAAAEDAAADDQINPTNGILIAVVIAAVLLLIALLVIIMSRRNAS